MLTLTAVMYSFAVNNCEQSKAFSKFVSFVDVYHEELTLSFIKELVVLLL